MTDPFDACRVAYEQGQRDEYQRLAIETAALIAQAEMRGVSSMIGSVEQRSYEQGQRDAIAAAVQRVEALPWDYIHSRGELITRAKAIAAIKGDQP
jgi:hypothetical protein